MMRIVVGIALVLLPLAGEGAESKVPACPGAEGFGRYAEGGRGGRVLFVTNLRDYDPRTEKPVPGSLRAACEAKGARIVVFGVSGTIELKTTIKIRESYLTLAGQSAPGDGICIKDHGIFVQASHVVIRHIRFRPGDEVGRRLAKEGKNWNTDALSVSSWKVEGPVHDIILDHCSTSWANDEVLSVSGADITNVTVQWCIISESIDNSTHGDGKHGYGSLIRSNGNISFHHNLYAYHRSRSPRPGTDGEGSLLLDFRNNVIHMGGTGYSKSDPMRMNYVGNHISQSKVFRGMKGNVLFVAGNYRIGDETGNTNNWQMIGGYPDRAEQAFPTGEVTTHTAREARELVLVGAGATLPKRDEVDVRVIAQVRADAPNEEDQIGEWPALKSTPRPEDGDVDGMPDAWERRYGLDPDESSDNRADKDGDGYTNIEEFLNQTDPQVRDGSY